MLTETDVRPVVGHSTANAKCSMLSAFHSHASGYEYGGSFNAAD